MQIEKELQISNKTVCQWMVFFREICMIIVQKYSSKLGGVGKIVQIDESHFGKPKHHRGQTANARWVLGGVEVRQNDTDPVKCFLEIVPDRTINTLIPIIQHYVLPHSTIWTDE